MLRVSCSPRGLDPSGLGVYQLWAILSGLFKPRYWILATGLWFLGISAVAKESKVKFCFNACLLTTAMIQKKGRDCRWSRRRCTSTPHPPSGSLHIWHALFQASHLGSLGLADTSPFSDFSIHPLMSTNLNILSPHHLRPARLGQGLSDHVFKPSSLILMVKASDHEFFCFVFGNVVNSQISLLLQKVLMMEITLGCTHSFYEES